MALSMATYAGREGSELLRIRIRASSSAAGTGAARTHKTTAMLRMRAVSRAHLLNGCCRAMFKMGCGGREW